MYMHPFAFKSDEHNQQRQHGFLSEDSWWLGTLTVAAIVALRILECSDAVLVMMSAGVACSIFAAALRPDVLIGQKKSMIEESGHRVSSRNASYLYKVMASKAYRRTRFGKAKTSCRQKHLSTSNAFVPNPTRPVVVFSKDEFVSPSADKAASKVPAKIEAVSGPCNVDSAYAHSNSPNNDKLDPHGDTLLETNACGSSDAKRSFHPGSESSTAYMNSPMRDDILQPPGIVDHPSCPRLPSIGSKDHILDTCKPCAFFHAKGCANGISCSFCHICEQGEIRSRRKEQKEWLREQKIHDRWVAEQAKRKRVSTASTSVAPVTPGLISQLPAPSAAR